MYQQTQNEPDEKRIRVARNWLYRLMQDFGPNKLVRPPDKRITLEFLRVSPWPALQAMLRQMLEQKTPTGHSYAWFVCVAQQRINGFTLEQIRDQRRAVNSLRRDQREREDEARL
jgi:hypothetical protein